MELKNVSRYFDDAKTNFAINGDELDPYIKDFILDINKYKDFVSTWSCEGHIDRNTSYLCFLVSPGLWDMFWYEIYPKYKKFCRYRQGCNVTISYCKVNARWNRGSIRFGNKDYRYKSDFWDFIFTEFIQFFEKYSVKEDVELNLKIRDYDQLR